MKWIMLIHVQHFSHGALYCTSGAKSVNFCLHTSWHMQLKIKRNWDCHYCNCTCLQPFYPIQVLAVITTHIHMYIYTLFPSLPCQYAAIHHGLGMSADKWGEYPKYWLSLFSTGPIPMMNLVTSLVCLFVCHSVQSHILVTGIGIS